MESTSSPRGDLWYADIPHNTAGGSFKGFSNGFERTGSQTVPPRIEAEAIGFPQHVENMWESCGLLTGRRWGDKWTANIGRQRRL